METTNLSKIRRDKMLNTISEIKKSITDEETLTNLSMIENELTKKKYGLIWEEHEERVDKELETKIPTFEEVKDKEIVSDPDDKFNFLLEGDNLHSLYLLEKTKKEKIDLIIIDPPYNTGSNDFMYGDKYLNNDDEFKHSKWLSFMSKRLNIAKNLLNDNGLIFIHIDDNELASLRLLCDEIFGEENFVNCICTKMSESSGVKMTHINKRLTKIKEYILLYKKNNIEIKPVKVRKEKWDNEYNKMLLNFTKDDRNEINKLILSNDIDDEKIDKIDRILEKVVISNVPKAKLDDENWLVENSYRIFRTAASTSAQNLTLIKKNKINQKIFSVLSSKGKIYIVKSDFLESSVKPRVQILFADDYLTTYLGDLWNDISTTGLEIEGNVNFKNGKKPLKLTKRILNLLPKKDCIVLDFFAGSGTTAQAVLELNNEDNGNRHFILCTNNENKICENITYKRIKNVIEGYGKYNALKANLKYYKCTYIPRINTENENLHNNLLINIKNLIQLENGIEVDDNKIRIYLDEDKLDEFSKNQLQLDVCKKLYISSDILLTSMQESIFKNNNIEVYIIPEYYFEDEIMEVM